MKTEKKRIIMAVAGIAIGIIIALVLTPPAALETAAAEKGSTGRTAMVVLGTAVWAVFWWVGDVVPDWVTAVGMIVIWTLTGCCSFEMAFAQFGMSTVWLLIGAFSIAGAVTKTGALKRIALQMMRLFPTTFRGQVLSLITVGTAVAPLIPSSAAKSILGSNISVMTAVAMKFPKFSKGGTGILMAAWVGFVISAPSFLSASSVCYMVKNALPPDVASGVTWIRWLIAALPLTLILVFGMYFVIVRLYRHDTKSEATKESVKTEIAKLGKMSRNEGLSIIIMFLCFVCWIFEELIGVSAALTAVIGGLLCFTLRVLEPKEIATRVPWGLILFIGGVLQMGAVLGSTGISLWLQNVLGPVFEGISGRYVLVAVVFIFTVIIRFFLVSQMSAIMILLAVLTPIVQALGMSPFVLGIILITATQIWFIPYQNINLIAATAAADGYVRNRDLFKCSVGYFFVALAGCLISVPFWSLLGYM